MKIYDVSTSEVRGCFLDGAEGSYIREDFDAWLYKRDIEERVYALQQAQSILAGETPVGQAREDRASTLSLAEAIRLLDEEIQFLEGVNNGE